MLGRINPPDDIRFSKQYVVKKQGGTFILGKAVRVDPEEETVFILKTSRSTKWVSMLYGKTQCYIRILWHR
ncbi:MAG: hypothetical protein KJ687_04430 [Proteobacteria bacterium]|nr:hypothetical protein [Pseudomonadota bacterium]